MRVLAGSCTQNSTPFHIFSFFMKTHNDDKFSLISTVQMKDPNTVLLVSIFLGVLGIDRFMIGDTGMGILKLLTCGCCGVLTIIDWFTISKKTRELNFNKVMTLL